MLTVLSAYQLSLSLSAYQLALSTYQLALSAYQLAPLSDYILSYQIPVLRVMGTKVPYPYPYLYGYCVLTSGQSTFRYLLALRLRQCLAGHIPVLRIRIGFQFQCGYGSGSSIFCQC